MQRGEPEKNSYRLTAKKKIGGKTPYSLTGKKVGGKISAVRRVLPSYLGPHR